MRKQLQGCGDVKVHPYDAGYKSPLPGHEKKRLSDVSCSFIWSYCRSALLKKRATLEKEWRSGLFQR